MIGVLLLVLPWVLGYPAAAAANSLVVGALFVLLGSVRGPLNHQTGGGWSWLWGAHARR